MCIFSRKAAVSKTNIFARAGQDGRQFLVYSMTVKADEELAMILPIPVPKNSKEDAVQFLNLEKYPTFFDDMRKGWPEPVTLSRGGAKAAPGAATDKKLEVVEVGSFIASFVPTLKDFARLDEKFRLPDGTWEKLPQYKEYGFAVFQLKKGEKQIHPMAFDFPRANPKKLFFPTVHIHDGKVEEKAKFDHTLYAQATGGEMLLDWEESPQPAELFMTKLDQAHGIVQPKEHAYRKRMNGMLKNEDVVV
jgi:hypothetical protein